MVSACAAGSATRGLLRPVSLLNHLSTAHVLIRMSAPPGAIGHFWNWKRLPPVAARCALTPQLVRLGSWLFILLGVSCLAGGTEALAATARAFAACLPPWAWRLLPRPVAVTVHKLQKQRTQQQHQQQQGSMGSEEDEEGLEDLV